MRVRKKAYKVIKKILATGETAVKGKHAAIDTSDGLCYDCDTASTTLLPIGRFAENLATGDGSTEVLIDLYGEFAMQNWKNDTAPNDVQAANLFSSVFIKDGETVSTSNGGGTRSVAGRAIAIEGGRIYVQAGIGVTGPSGLGANWSSGVADKAALSAIVAASRFTGMQVMVRADGSMWRFDGTSTATEDAGQELVIAPDAGSGRWISNDKFKTLKLPIDYTTADGAAILTVPADMTLRLAAFPYWEVTTGFTGGSSSAIGVSTSISGYDTKGDILGGASGDVAATLVAGDVAGTLGGELDDNVVFQALCLVAADEIQFDRITSVFTAGAGFVCLPVAIAAT
ncbi:MAG: hypothetical protein GY700_13545 [Propionibacteriaceae bacterium]|nr:hypothetical protein [Propionibacteriaceae bacterium]